MIISPKVSNLNVFLALDYSQLEVRILAEASGDKLLIQQLNDGRDIHSIIGNTLTGAKVEDIRKDDVLRAAVKGFVFSLVYGVSKRALYGHLIGEGVKITQQRAEQFYDRFFQRYTGVAAFMDKAQRFVEKYGYSETIFGFKSQIRKVDETRTTFWGNQAINRPIQGAAHQLLLIAMALLKLKPRTYELLHWGSKILMEVHDALYFRIPLYTLPEAYRVALKLFQVDIPAYIEQYFKRTLGVPLVAEAKAGFCMGSMVDYKGEPIEEFLPKWREKHLEIESRPLTKLLPKLKFGDEAEAN